MNGVNNTKNTRADSLSIRLENFSRRIGHETILNKINLEIETGEIICLAGENGAGKSTLLSTISSPQKLYTGKIIFNQKTLENNTDRINLLRQCAYLGHNPGLFNDLNIIENLNFFDNISRNKLRQTREDKLENKKRRDFYLDLTGLAEHKKQLVRFLSRGMKQKLGLIRCFLSLNKILFLDEPLNALDSNGKKMLHEYLSTHKKNHITLIASHDLVFFSEKQVATRFLFLKQGSLIGDISSSRYTNKAKENIKKLLAS